MLGNPSHAIEGKWYPGEMDPVDKMRASLHPDSMGYSRDYHCGLPAARLWLMSRQRKMAVNKSKMLMELVSVILFTGPA